MTDEKTVAYPTLAEGLPITGVVIQDGETALFELIQDGEEVGKLRFVDGVLTFEGDADESAKIFFDGVIKQYYDFKELEALEE